MHTILRPVRFIAFILFVGGILCGCADYGEMLDLDKGKLYYSEGVSEADVEKLSGYLIDEGYFEGGVVEDRYFKEEEKSVQFRKEGDRYVFRAIILQEFLNDENIENAFEVFGAQMSRALFNGAPVDVHLTNNRFETRKKIPFDPAADMTESETTMPEADTVSSEGDTVSN